MQELKTQDPEIWQAIELEEKRQQNTIELIASENFTSPAVRQATGSCLTHKYAEGYPGKRYYGGCEHADQVEEMARSRVQKLFQSSYANVQPHSGSQANMAVYFGFLQPGDTVLGMDLAHGGHLTHGSRVNFSGRIYKGISYGLHPETQTIDYDQILDLARKHRPRLIIAGASAYPRSIDFSKFRQIAQETGAKLMVDMAHIAGLVAVGLHPSPLQEADFVTSTTHKSLRGPRGGFILSNHDVGKVLDSQIFPGLQGGPLMHVIAAKAVAFGEALQPEFKAYQKQVLANSRALGFNLKELGYELISGGTDNHLLLMDLRNKEITGKEAELVLDRVGITANKNSVPSDPQPATVTSGIRLGTPVVTTRGMREEDMARIANWMDQALQNRKDESRLEQLSLEIQDFAAGFPLFVTCPQGKLDMAGTADN
ncbi:MAG: serine hydroxymethyltransferase [Desulfohalobiaceae bacterium]